MTENDNSPTLDDIQPVTEHAPRDRQEHGKAPGRPDDDDLSRRTEQERVEAGVDDYDADQIPPADA